MHQTGVARPGANASVVVSSCCRRCLCLLARVAATHGSRWDACLGLDALVLPQCSLLGRMDNVYPHQRRHQASETVPHCSCGAAACASAVVPARVYTGAAARRQHRRCGRAGDGYRRATCHVDDVALVASRVAAASQSRRTCTSVSHHSPLVRRHATNRRRTARHRPIRCAGGSRRHT